MTPGKLLLPGHKTNERETKTVSIPRFRAEVATHLGGTKDFPGSKPWRTRVRSGETEVLRDGHVPLSQWRGASRRTSGRLYGNRYSVSIQADARLQCFASHGLGRVWTTCGTVCHKDGTTSFGNDCPKYRPF